MKIITEIAELEAVVDALKKTETKIGFVPTMGFLHEGHISLVNESKKSGTFTIASIYVNPTQFNDSNDFDNYPRNIPADTALLKENACDLVFIPSNKSMIDRMKDVEIDLNGLENDLEGEYRPGHFKGVVKVLDAFFSMVQPDRAYFGEKDFQQLLVVRKLAKSKFPDIEIVGIPTKRENDGLAMSSRNVRLSEKSRLISNRIHKALTNVVQLSKTNLNVVNLLAESKKIFDDVPVKLEYFELRDREDFKKVDRLKKGSDYVVCAAAYIDEVRLIDNITFNC